MVHTCKVFVCLAVGLLGLIAFIVGIAAKSHAIKPDQAVVSSDSTTCTYPSSPAAGLAIVGGLLILVAQSIANAFGGCVCCWRRKNDTSSSGARTGAILCLILSWILTVISFALLLIAGAQNSSLTWKAKPDPNDSFYVYCPVPDSRLLPIGGCLAFAAAALAIVFYLLATSGSAGDRRPAGAASEVQMPPAYPVYHK